MAIHAHIQGDTATMGSIEALIQKIYSELKIDTSIKYEPNAATVGQQLAKSKKSGITINIPAAAAPVSNSMAKFRSGQWNNKTKGQP